VSRIHVNAGFVVGVATCVVLSVYVRLVDLCCVAALRDLHPAASAAEMRCSNDDGDVAMDFSLLTVATIDCWSFVAVRALSYVHICLADELNKSSSRPSGQ